MTELPHCDRRELLPEPGLIRCKDPRVLASTRGIPESICLACWYRDHPPPPPGESPDWRQRLELACVHRGAATGEVRECASCGGVLRAEIHPCAVYGECATSVVLTGLMCCRICPDRREPG